MTSENTLHSKGVFTVWDGIFFHTVSGFLNSQFAIGSYTSDESVKIKKFKKINPNMVVLTEVL